MQRLTIFAALVSVASAQYRQFRTTEQDAAETSAAAAAATAAAPSKFEGLVNVTWNPEWTGPFNFSELQESVGDKFDLASLAGSQVMSGLNLVPNLFSNASISAVLTAVNGYAGYTVANAYNLVATVVFPATVTVILFAGVIYIVQVAIQVLRSLLKI
jgi:hypothetical protein